VEARDYKLLKTETSKYPSLGIYTWKSKEDTSTEKVWDGLRISAPADSLMYSYL
jgi:hypothetical protein